MKEKIIKIVKNILIFLSYFMYHYIFIAILLMFNINYNEFGTFQKLLFIFVTDIIYIMTIVYLLRDEIINDLKDFKKKYKYYISKYFTIYALGVILMGLSNKILYYITRQELSGNETSIRSLLDQFPIYMVFSAVIFAPVVEEIIFRKTVRNVFNKKYLYIILSGLIFGVLHISDYSNFNEILLGIPYVIMGIDFAYIYYKSNNIFTTITLHSIHNLLLVLIQFIF
ncbi:MAG: CPBP family intramembrane metalloprotease [Bacilli bacterium]|nr:CPBP family intramembrane metalloprotease [Bacilli bacterium]